MSIQLSATEFKAQCLALMDAVAERGTRYVITKHGVPVAALVPADAVERSPIGFLHGTIAEHGDLIAADHRSWRHHSDPLD